MELTPGARLGPYKIERALGSGGMGAVYLAYDERLERRVALKALKEAPSAEAQQRLQREARAIARLNHSNIAAVYDVFEHDHEAFLVMEYVDGEPLTALVDRATGADRTRARHRTAAHRSVELRAPRGIIHRDVKPANVMLTRSGKVKVLDLGLARAAGRSRRRHAQRSQVELVPSRAGTPAYMAPERLGGHPADAPTDVYSVGVLLFELLTGKRPYVAPDLMTLAVNVATQPTPHVSTTRKDVPPMLDDLVARAMAKDRATRYASAAEVHDALARVRDPHRRTIPRLAREWRTTWRWRVPIGVGLIAALAIGAWLMFHGAAPRVVVSPATVAIPPVINGSANQPELDELGSLLQSVLSRNLAFLPGVTIVPASASPARTQASAPGPPAPPGYTLSVTIRRAVAGLAADVEILRGGERLSGPQPFTGDELGLLRSGLEGLVTALEQRLFPGRTIPEAEPNQLRELPTKDRQALLSYLRGRRLLDISDDRGTDQRAIDAFQEAINRDKAFAFAYAGLSLAYSSLLKHTGDSRWLDSAGELASQASAADRKCDQARVALALVLRAQQRYSDAIAEARLAVAFTPDNDDAHRVLGLTLLDDNQADDGIAELQTAVALRPGRLLNQYYLGTGLLLVHKDQQAIAPLKKATEQQPNFESGWANLGAAYYRVGDWEKSSGSSSRALELNKNDAAAVNNLAIAYYWDGKYNLALQRFQEAVSLDPAVAPFVT